MAHVKCRYDRYSCSIGNKECWECNYQPRDENICNFLQCDASYFEKTSKTVSFDGQDLIVGREFSANIHDYGSVPWVDENTIDYLEIDGIVYYGEAKEKAGHD